jgi:hypothetical protein
MEASSSSQASRRLCKSRRYEDVLDLRWRVHTDAGAAGTTTAVIITVPPVCLFDFNQVCFNAQANPVCARLCRSAVSVSDPLQRARDFIASAAASSTYLWFLPKYSLTQTQSSFRGRDRARCSSVKSCHLACQDFYRSSKNIRFS